jgi:hypothetical protein
VGSTLGPFIDEELQKLAEASRASRDVVERLRMAREALAVVRDALAHRPDAVPLVDAVSTAVEEALFLLEEPSEV